MVLEIKCIKDAFSELNCVTGQASMVDDDYRGLSRESGVKNVEKRSLNGQNIEEMKFGGQKRQSLKVIKSRGLK